MLLSFPLSIAFLLPWNHIFYAIKICFKQCTIKVTVIIIKSWKIINKCYSYDWEKQIWERTVVKANKSLLTKDHIHLTSKKGGGPAEHKLYLWKTSDSGNNDSNYRESSYLRTEINKKPQKTAKSNTNVSFFWFKLSRVNLK